MKLEAELDALRALDPEAPEAVPALRAALRRSTGVVVGRAADLVRRGRVHALTAELEPAFFRLLERPVKRDPGCNGKLALARAIEELGGGEGALLAGVRHVQKEPAWGPPVDTAPALRGLCGHVLASRLHPRAGVLLADLLADPEPPARQGAVAALVSLGAPGVALLRYKLRVGDDDPVVLGDALTALSELDWEAALEVGREWLDGEDPDQRETAALALGQTRKPEVLPVLAEAVVAAVDRDERRVLLVAIGTLRLEVARAWLLDRLESEPELVIEALRPYRFEPGLVELVRARVPRWAGLVDDQLG